MSKLHAAWIVLIVFCSLIVLGAVCYLFYRLYINHIYKGQRSWSDILSSSSSNRTSAQITNSRIPSLKPRRSIAPLIQTFLSRPSRKSSTDRRMVTDLGFDEAPSFQTNLNTEWENMDTRNSLETMLCSLMSDDLHLGVISIRSVSSGTSYHTAKGQTSCVGSIDDELSSSANYCSFTSADESRASIDRHAPVVDIHKQTITSLPANETGKDLSLLNHSPPSRINLSNNAPAV